mgnify:CR=1 FL=1
MQAYLERWHRGEIPYTYQDQAMDESAMRAILAAPDPATALCAERRLWGKARRLLEQAAVRQPVTYQRIAAHET